MNVKKLIVTFLSGMGGVTQEIVRTPERLRSSTPRAA